MRKKIIAGLLGLSLAMQSLAPTISVLATQTTEPIVASTGTPSSNTGDTTADAPMTDKTPAYRLISLNNKVKSDLKVSEKSIDSIASTLKKNKSLKFVDGVDLKVNYGSQTTITEDIKALIFNEDAASDVYLTDDEVTANDYVVARSHLLEEGIINRLQSISVNKSGAVELNHDAKFDTSNPNLVNEKESSSAKINKTELYTMLYKIFYGSIESRPVIWQASVGDGSYDYYSYVNPDVYELYLSALLDKGIINSSELIGYTTYTKFKNEIKSLEDYTTLQTYLSLRSNFITASNSKLSVYREAGGASGIKLKSALKKTKLTYYEYGRSTTNPNKLKMTSNEITLTDAQKTLATYESQHKTWLGLNNYVYDSKGRGNTFLWQYNAYKGDISKITSIELTPKWAATSIALVKDKTSGGILADSASRYFGSSYNIKRYNSNSFGDSTSDTDTLLLAKEPRYFRDESLTNYEAMQIIEKFMRVSEKDMTALEADVISYKYEVSYLSGLDSDQKDTVKFLIAKGIIDFENNEEFINYNEIANKLLIYRLLYRVADEDARLNFSNLQLTDGETFWLSKGFGSTEIDIANSSATSSVVNVSEGTTVATNDTGEGSVDGITDSTSSSTVVKSEEDIAAEIIRIGNLVTPADGDISDYTITPVGDKQSDGSYVSTELYTLQSDYDLDLNAETTDDVIKSGTKLEFKIVDKPSGSLDNQATVFNRKIYLIYEDKEYYVANEKKYLAYTLDDNSQKQFNGNIVTERRLVVSREPNTLAKDREILVSAIDNSYEYSQWVIVEYNTNDTDTTETDTSPDSEMEDTEEDTEESTEESEDESGDIAPSPSPSPTESTVPTESPVPTESANTASTSRSYKVGFFDSLRTLVNPITVQAADKKSYTITLKLTYATSDTSKLNQAKYYYSYNGVKLQFQELTNSSKYKTASQIVTDNKETIENLVAVTKTDKGKKKLQYVLLTVRVSATSEEKALQIAQKNLKASKALSNKSSAIGAVKKINTTQSSDSSELIMVSKSELRNADGINITFLSDNLIYNKDTGVSAYVSEANKYALVGNKIARCKENMIIKDSSGETFYNLKVVCALLDNATITEVAGESVMLYGNVSSGSADAEVTGLLAAEDKYVNVYAEDTDTVLGGDYIIESYEDTIAQVSSAYTNTTPRTYKNLINLDSLTYGTNTITKDVTVKLGATGRSSKVYIIVSWDFVVPQGVSDDLDLTLEQLKNGLSYKDVTAIMTEPPEDAFLREWWDMNLGMSNAIARYMYGKTGNEEFITCGYLVPSIRILTTDGVIVKASNLDAANGKFWSYEDNSLGEKQINALFSTIKFSSSYTKRYLDGSTENWWKKYYQTLNDSQINKLNLADGQTLNELKSVAGSFQVFRGKPLVEEKGGYAFDDFVISRFGTIYMSIPDATDANTTAPSSVEYQSNIVYGNTEENGKCIIFSSTDSESRLVDGAKIISDLKNPEGFYYKLGSKEINGVLYYALAPYDTKTRAVILTKLDKNSIISSINSNKGSLRLKDLKCANGTKLVDYEKSLYSTLGLTYYPGKTNTKMEAGFRFSTIRGSSAQATAASGTDVYTGFNTTTLKNVSILGGSSKGFLKYTRYKKDYKDSTEYQSESDINKIIPTESNDIYTVVSVLVPATSAYFTNTTSSSLQNEQVCTIVEGTALRYLNGDITFSSLNAGMIDSIMLKDQSVISVKDVPKDARLIIGNYRFVSNGGGTFTCSNVKHSSSASDNSLAYKVLMAYKRKRSSSAKKAVLLSPFAQRFITCSGRIYSLTEFIDDIGLATGSKKKSVIASGKSVAMINNKNQALSLEKVFKTYKNKGTKLKKDTLDYGVAIEIKLNEVLRCKPINDISDQTTTPIYQLLNATEDVSSSGFDSLPFDISLDEEASIIGDNLASSISTSKYDGLSYMEALKKRFMDDYNAALAGNWLYFIKFVIVVVLMFLTITIPMAYCCIRSASIKPIFLAIRTKSGSFDLIKIVTLGILNLDDEPSLVRVLLFDFVVFFAAYIIVNYLG